MSHPLDPTQTRPEFVFPIHLFYNKQIPVRLLSMRKSIWLDSANDACFCWQTGTQLGSLAQ